MDDCDLMSNAFEHDSNPGPGANDLDHLKQIGVILRSKMCKSVGKERRSNHTRRNILGMKGCQVKRFCFQVKLIKSDN